MIKAITFDLGNTLFKNISYTDIRIDLLVKFLEENGFKITHSYLKKVFNNNFNFLKLHYKPGQYQHIYTQTVINNMFNELKIELEPEKRKKINDLLGSVILTNPPALKKGVFDTLSTLSVDYSIGMISDTAITPGRIIREVLKDYDILDFFDVTVFSDETGFRKPHPIAFKTALNHLDTSPRNAIHVGDLLDTDIKGAIDYQMQAVWIRDPQTQNPGIFIPNYEISEIPEILKIINKLNLKRFNP